MRACSVGMSVGPAPAGIGTESPLCVVYGVTRKKIGQFAPVELIACSIGQRM